MNSGSYFSYEKPQLDRLCTPLVEATALLARIDERLYGSPWLGAAVSRRMLFSQACAWQLAEGELVYMDELVALDAGVPIGPPSIALSRAHDTLRSWRMSLSMDPRQLLADPVPTNSPALAQMGEQQPERRPCNPDRLRDWKNVLQQSNEFPALLAAAATWEAWNALDPEENGGWRAALLAALLMKSRGLTTQFLLPLDTGRKHVAVQRPVPRTTEQHLVFFIDLVSAACSVVGKEVDRLVLANELLRLKIQGHQKNSHLPQLVDLLLVCPVVSIPHAAKQLRITQQSVSALIPQLGAYVHEITGGRRYRAWALN